MFKWFYPLLIVAIASAVYLTMGAANVPIRYSFDFHPNGHGRVFAPEITQKPIWIIDCPRPMRDCRARNGDIQARVTDGQLIISTYVQPHQSMFIVNGWRDWKTSAAALRIPDPKLTEVLIRPQARLRIESANNLAETRSLVGLDQVVDYLSWLEGDVARATRDARLWYNGAASHDTGDNSVLALRIANVVRLAGNTNAPIDLGENSFVKLP